VTDLPNSGMRLGADLYGLWRAGQLHLPALADEFMAASDAAAQTDVGLTNAFMRPSAFGGGSYGPVNSSIYCIEEHAPSIVRDIGGF